MLPAHLSMTLSSSKINLESYTFEKIDESNFVGQYAGFSINFEVVNDCKVIILLKKNDQTVQSHTLEARSRFALKPLIIEVLDQWNEEFFAQNAIDTGYFGYKLDTFDLPDDQLAVFEISVRTGPQGDFETRTFESTDPEVIRLTKLYLYMQKNVCVNKALTSNETNPHYFLDDGKDIALKNLLTSCIQWVVSRMTFTAF